MLTIVQANINNRSLRPFGYRTRITTPAKLIWDKDSAQLRISGFPTAVNADPKKEWNDHIYRRYQHVKIP
jgi:hypothetical protein